MKLTSINDSEGVSRSYFHWLYAQVITGRNIKLDMKVPGLFKELQKYLQLTSSSSDFLLQPHDLGSKLIIQRSG